MCLSWLRDDQAGRTKVKKLGPSPNPRDDVIVMPHTAGSTHESFARIADIVAGNIRRLHGGAELSHRVA